VVRLYGRWCGPNWTDGRAISARDYLLQGGNFKSPCADRLDCACRDHDESCARSGGCTSKADRILARKAAWISLTTTDPLEKQAAKLISSGIFVASLTRSR
jgi:hypothetical protein